MIFNNIDDITSKADKSLLLELIDVYVKSVKEMASRKHVDVIGDTHILPPEEVVSEIIEMGIIRSKEQLTLLKRVLGSLYPDFINSVSTYIYHRKQFDGVLDKFNNRKRMQMQAVELASDKPVVADFFAGAGGLSLGFSQAGYRICFANDFQDVCINTYRFNHPEIPSNRILCDDIRKIVDNIQDYVTEDVDIVIGGPPCQGFSSANQQRIIDDPRNELYKYYIKAVTKIVPKFVLMENVRGMMSVADQVVEDFRSIKATKNGIEYNNSIQWLEDAGIVRRCYNIQTTELPLEGNSIKDCFKVYTTDIGLLVAMLDYGTQADILKGNLFGYKGAIFENLMADFLSKSGQKLYYLHKDSGLELDFLVRFKGECVILEIKAKTGKSKSMTTVLKNKNVYHVKNAIKLGQYNVEREGNMLTIPLYMGFLVNDKLADVIIPDVDVSLLTV